MSKNDSVAKAVDAISKGDVRSLRKNIKEAIVAKVRRALEKKEQKIAKDFLNNKDN